MKRIISVLACFFFLAANVSALSARDIKEEGQILVLESSNLEYSFGDVLRDKIIKRKIKIKNKLNEALHIKEARPSCECIEVELESQTVERNGVFELDIIFDSRGVEGSVESMIYILTENMKYELIRLKIVSRVIE